jgi:hypothetical protein
MSTLPEVEQQSQTDDNNINNQAQARDEGGAIGIEIDLETTGVIGPAQTVITMEWLTIDIYQSLY